jgi:vitamin B12 transporter
MRHLLLVAGILGGGIPALAQSEPPANPQTPVPSFQDSVVVSASLDPEQLQETPAAVTVIHQQEIEARQDDSLSELISTVPGVTVAQSGGPGQVTSVWMRGAESDQTLMLWNGIPLNDPYFGGVNWSFLPTDGLERVEVVRGPFSALYGSNAVGGVVQVLTGAQQGGTLRLEGGENSYGRAALAAGTDVGKLRFDATGHVRRGDGALDNEFFDSEELVTRALWTLKPGVSLGVMARANDSDTGIPFSGATLTPHRKISWQERELAVPFTATQGDWEVAAQLSRTTFDSAYRDPDDPFGFVASDTESEGLRGRTVVTWHGHEGLSLSGGTEVERLEVTSSSNFGTDLDGARQRTWAVFGQASWGRGPVHFDVGLRRDDNDVYGGQTSLRTGAVVAVGAGVRLRASYGEAFRAPSLGELFFPGSGNPDLKPETGETWELGIEREAGGFRAALTGFETRQRNLIDFDFATFRDVNVGRSRSRGLEAELGYEKGIWAARLNGTYLDAEDRDTGLPLLRRPKRAGNLVLTARPGVWTFNVEGRWVGDRPDVDPVTFARSESPSFARVDLAAKWKATQRFSPYARVENAADREYSEVLGFPSPGRTWIGGVAVEF